MCELLGLNSNAPADITFSFTGLVKRGNHHKDGWGISFYEGKSCRQFHDPLPSINSEIAKFIKSYPIKSKIIISHLRKANRGKVCLANTHPFRRELWGRHWSFAHNGQLKSVKKLQLKRYFPVGTTDSEHAFCWLMDQIAHKYPKAPTAKQCSRYWQFVYEQCLSLAELGAFNVLFTDSDHLFAFCSTKLHWLTRKAPFGEAQLKDDDIKINFNEKNSKNDIISIIATEPITNNENWHKMSKKEFHIFRNGVNIKQYYNHEG
jgi:glutamine amidotransferase